ncbi:MAG: preprotein translocase subunit SecY [Rhodobacteraceae bacterium]|nr:preprotein translocase subunit SecY [Paracoccaceae bacterium]
MASAAEQMAANMSWGALGKSGDLRSRIFFALGLLMVYRVGTYIPVPGIDPVALAAFFEDQAGGIGGILDMFTGGALSRLAIFTLGIMPYISASIIIQLMTSMVPSLEALKKEGEQGRKKINQYTRYGTFFLALAQSYAIAVGLESQGLASDPGLFFRASAMITLVGGTMFLMWLGEQITARGIGNGISLIIFVGIIAGLPGAIAQFFAAGRTGSLSTPIILFMPVMVLAVVAFVVFVERALRKVHIQYPKRQVGMKMYGGESSHLPMKLNPSGVIPAIFASSILLLPTTITTFSSDGGTGFLATIAAYMGRGQPLYMLTSAAFVIFFAYFYTHNVAFKTDDVADNLKKQGGFVPGIRPGAKTAAYLDYVMNRLLVVGSLYLAAVVILPEFLQANGAISFAFSGTSILIVVSVTMDTINQVQSHMLAHQYEGLIEKSKMRGKNRSKARNARR